MNVLFVSSEAVPFAKTGGLADVGGALPAALARLGQQVTLILPAYRQALASGQPIEATDVELAIPIGSKTVPGRLLESRLPCGVPVVLVQQDEYYDRPGLYGDGEKEYVDNCERYVFFCRAVLEAVRLLDLKVDLVHANDWQTGLVPAYLNLEYRQQSHFEQTASLFTIHNLAYQGLFWQWDMLLTGLDWKYFNWQQMEFFGQLNLLKTGLVFADALSTVSRRYAEEIQTSEHGCGLEGVLRQRRDALTGIINGVDYEQWNPADDRFLPQAYGLENVDQGKAACKAALAAELGLPHDAARPLVGFIGRLVEQKGIDLLVEVLNDAPRWTDAQWVILGTGQDKYEEQLTRLALAHPQQIAVRVGFDEGLAHRIEAAADVFLMPSRFEPCGLNQLYSLRYGTVPVVRATGGLADTIVDASPEAIAQGRATGFTFREPSGYALREAIERALVAYRQRELWARLIASGMQQDWSWARSASEYVALYEQTLAHLKQEVCS